MTPSDPTDAGPPDPERLARGGNRLLAAVPPEDLRRLAPACRCVEFGLHEVLSPADTLLRYAYFPERGVISIVGRDKRGERTEIALVGPEGFLGAPLILGDGRWPYESFVQLGDLHAVRVDADALVAAAEASAGLRGLLLRAVQVQMVQVAEGLVSASWQRIPARLARWLLMCRDRTGSDRIQTTHEAIALMVGAQRSGITLALHELEGEGLIGATRGQILIRRPDTLKQVADGSYGVSEREDARLLGSG